MDPALDPKAIAELSRALLESVTNGSRYIEMNSNIILRYQQQQGYVPHLLHIISTNLTQPNMNQLLVSAAFAQLKVVTRNYWNKENGRGVIINQRDKSCFINSIVQMSFLINSISNRELTYRYMKLLKDIIERAKTEVIVILPELINSIKLSLQSEEMMQVLPIYLNIFLGVFNELDMNVSEEFIVKSIKIYEALHPILYNLVALGDERIQELYALLEETHEPSNLNKYLQFKKKYQQVLYLSIKIFYLSLKLKEVYFKKVINIILAWIPIVISRIEYIDPTFTPSLSDQAPFNYQQMGYKGNDAFNYFHSKKWSLKYFMRSMRVVLILKKGSLTTNKVIQQFYTHSFEQTVDIFKSMSQYKWPIRIQFLLLKSFTTFITKKPKLLVEKYESLLKHYLQQVLPPKMLLTTKDMDILDDSPIQFINDEENIGLAAGVRGSAIDLWLNIARIKNNYIKYCSNSIFINFSFSIIKQLIQDFNSDPLRYRDVGCFLLTQLHRQLKKEKSIAGQLNKFINKVITDNLTNSQDHHFLVVMRAIDLFIAYHQNVNKEITHNMMNLLFQLFNAYNPDVQLDSKAVILMLKGCKAASIIIKVQQSSQMFDVEILKMIVYKSLMLVQHSNYDQFIFLTNDILRYILNEIHDFAKDIVLFLHNWFKDYAEKEILCTNGQENGKYIEIARGTLNIFETLLFFVRSGNKEITSLLEQEIILILQYLFSRNAMEDECNDTAMSLLYSFLADYPAQQLNPRIVKILKKIIIQLVGLPQETIKQLKSREPKSQQQKNEIDGLIKCSSMRPCDFQSYVGIVKKFIQHIPYGQNIRGRVIIQKSILNEQTNCTEFLIYLVCRYCRGVVNVETDEGRCFALLMMIYYYEHHQQKQCQIKVCNKINILTQDIIIRTIGLFKERAIFSKYIVQLFSVLVFETKNHIIDILRHFFKQLKQEHIHRLCHQVYFYKTKIYQFGISSIRIIQQQNRCILGISCLIRLAAKQALIFNAIGESSLMVLFEECINFIHKRIQDEQGFDDPYAQVDYSQEDQKEMLQIVSQNYRQYYTEKAGQQPKVYQPSDQYQQQEIEEEVDKKYLQDQSDQQHIQRCADLEENLREDDQDLLKSINERVEFLHALLQFYRKYPGLYYKFVEALQCNSKIYDILDNCGCFIRDDSQLRDLQVLCDLHDEESMQNIQK